MEIKTFFPKCQNLDFAKKRAIQELLTTGATINLDDTFDTLLPDARTRPEELRVDQTLRKFINSKISDIPPEIVSDLTQKIATQKNSHAKVATNSHE